jgi:hypothetical protein
VGFALNCLKGQIDAVGKETLGLLCFLVSGRDRRML